MSYFHEYSMHKLEMESNLRHALSFIKNLESWQMSTGCLTSFFCLVVITLITDTCSVRELDPLSILRYAKAI